MQVVEFFKRYMTDNRNKSIIFIVSIVVSAVSMFVGIAFEQLLFLSIGSFMLLVSVVLITYHTFKITNFVIRPKNFKWYLKLLIYVLVANIPMSALKMSTFIFDKGYEIAEFSGNVSSTLTVLNGVYWVINNIGIVIMMIFAVVVERLFSRQTQGDIDSRKRKDTMQMQRDIDEIINKFN
ncbi:hypothetical protein P7H60_12270 [Vagococcus carniphilus]|uniref:hypothetical protein n=1 Tax=Vagococcus carniphilus TaxID=218144 RepID=UPI002891423D|nr:hypothetical protein [Vagococcus carniphilus]MDT2849919.1 hypothetical protein [Vagococcus carniphilus]